ncbi:hypothetical protein PoB_003796300 [Plakobranchus ocellatus]|uniref:Uncharacterized protein n=1 Tax=Plakobranchus ocellatus TaxID=259542 RepID=A0AAV4AY99_9GAST|nr:hypothetical protein PoB_003796300 [Plakobranchus ocellatus]
MRFSKILLYSINELYERRTSVRDSGLLGKERKMNPSGSGERKGSRRLAERDVEAGIPKDIRQNTKLGVPNEKHFAIT